MAELSDIPYFEAQRVRWPAIYNLAEHVKEVSGQNPQNAHEFERRLDGLAQVPDPIGEQRRQAVNFLSELVVFDDLAEHGHEPLWVPEHPKLKMPDIEYRDDDGMLVPVEVKHLNPPRDEDIALSTGQSYGGIIREEDLPYERYLGRKVHDFVDQSEQKLADYTAMQQGNDVLVAPDISLEILYTSSIEANLIDEMRGEVPMDERLRVIADDYAVDKPVIPYVSKLNDYFPPRTEG